MTDLEDMYAANRRNWDERVEIHLGPRGYNLSGLRAGRGRLDAIEERELADDIGELSGKRVIHLQCHFGLDTLTLAQRGAEVIGVDFSTPAIETARQLAQETRLTERVRFVECNLYDAPATVGEQAAFDLAYVTWGAINWLPDIRAWAEVVSHFLKPGGLLYLLEGHPSALVFDDQTKSPDGMPGWLVPYFGRSALKFDDPSDYMDEDAVLQNARTYEWVHPIGDVMAAVMGAGFRLRFLREHDGVAWRMFGCLEKSPDGLYRWPDKPWLPLSFSILAEKEPG